MKIPVIIPAYNEEALLSRALDSLPADIVEPIVIPNGCEDQTEAVALASGATVLSMPEASKMRAVQEGIKLLGNRAIDPFLLLDADSHAVFPRAWARSMLSAARVVDDRPAVVHGPIWYVNGPGPVANTFRSVRSVVRQSWYRHDDVRGYFFGANVLIHPKQPKVVDELLGLEDFWPGQDNATTDAVVRAGGKSYKTVRPGAMVATDAARHVSLTTRVVKGRVRVKGQVDASYLQQQPRGARKYERTKERERQGV